MKEETRLMEDYLPIEWISEVASSEPRSKGHISTMHIWRARRPLTACRPAIYAALMPGPKQGAWPKDTQRAEAKERIKSFGTYPGNRFAIQDAVQDLTEAHAARLSDELGIDVTADDIQAGRAPKPRVLDMFAGGGAIPLEAARLGCESHAVELNPVAHIIELCTVDFPQRFGTSIADDVEKWAKRVLDETRESVSDLYRKIPVSMIGNDDSAELLHERGEEDRHLSVVAYYWTRTALCPNPSCQATVPLYGQSWLRKKPSGYVALKPTLDRELKRVRFQVVEADTEAGLGFDPSAGSEASSTVCPFCQSALEGDYVREFGEQTGFGQQLMCVIALNPFGSGKIYLTDERLADSESDYEHQAEERAVRMEAELGNSSLDEPVPPTGNAGLATGISYLYGIPTFRQMFSPRQRLTLLTMASQIRSNHEEMVQGGMSGDRATAVCTYLGLWLSRLTDRCNTLSRWDNSSEKIQGLTSLKRFAMSWDFPEVNLFGGASGDALGNLEYITEVIRREGVFRNPSSCLRGSATELPYGDAYFDAVVTDPPYYDNESYSELSDACYIWMKPAIGFLYPEHFASPLTPKRKECVAAAYRQGGRNASKEFYENCIFESLQEANRVLKSGGILVLIYAHKTTLGWSTLIDAIRGAGFVVTEAWPVATEPTSRVAHRGDSALRSSIFLVARKSQLLAVGRYEDEVRPLLESIVGERVGSLWQMGISGADLLIASVGAGLRAFTRYKRVEYANGEQVPSERFLAEVEAVVLERILRELSEKSEVAGRVDLGAVDPETRCYILWRYTYRSAPVEAGEAIVFANGTHVELDGPESISAGPKALVSRKRKNNAVQYELRDYTERGEIESLGKPEDSGFPVPLIDSLHRVLWLMNHQPSGLADFLSETRPNLEQMRMVAQVLAGPVLRGGELPDVSPSAELAALSRLTSNWRAVIEEGLLPAGRSGQPSLLDGGEA